MRRRLVQVTTGDLFKADVQTLVNTVNCVGVMGKGIALEFKRRYPQMYSDYERRCRDGLVRLGEPYIYKPLTGPWILNFPTKAHWRQPSSLQAIKDGLVYIRSHVDEWGLTSIASPPLGCGLGQLDWRVVGPVLYQGFEALGIEVQLYAPPETPVDQMDHKFLSQGRSPQSLSNAAAEYRVPIGLIAVIEVLKRITDSGFFFPGSVGFQKISYFATTLGLPTGVSFRRGSHGPYSEDLAKLEIPKLINHDLLRQVSSADKIEHLPGGSYEYSNWRLPLDQYESKMRRLVDLFQRIKTTSQAELYATVHFVTDELRASYPSVSELDVQRQVSEWKKNRQRPFTDYEITDSIRILNLLGWIDVTVSDDLELSVEHQFERM